VSAIFLAVIWAGIFPAMPCATICRTASVWSVVVIGNPFNGYFLAGMAIVGGQGIEPREAATPRPLYLFVVILIIIIFF